MYKSILLFLFLAIRPILGENSLDMPKTEVLQEETEKFFQEMPSPQYQTALWKIVFLLFIFIALIFITFWLFKKIIRSKERAANQTQSIRVLEKRTISTKSVLYLIDVDGEKVLISESQVEVNPLHTLGANAKTK